VGIGAVALTAVVAAIYRDVTRTYYFNDDFQWLQGARTFALANVLHIERYNHFYRPIIEIYFFIGRRAFGCDALSFHLASVAVHLCNTALLYGFAFFSLHVSGKIAPIGMIYSAGLLVYGLTQIGRLRQRPMLAFFLLAQCLNLALCIGWAIYWGGLPNFSETGFIK